MNRYVLDIQQVDRTHAALAGGKGANLGELSRLRGVRVPPGFCVTTDAFRRVLEEARVEGRLAAMSRLEPDDVAAIGALGAEVRDMISATPVPTDVAAEIAAALGRLGERTSCAIRSSATAEDLTTASFAGQQDSFLNVVGAAAVLRHVVLCWASLFTDRAVIYRQRHGFDHQQVAMAVVVQRMVFPQVAGVLFTADPANGNRNIAVVEASYGLGEAVVAGRVNADVYRVRDGAVVARSIGTKQLAVCATPDGGTHEIVVDPRRRQAPALSATQAAELASLGRVVEARFGSPQDIEWCLADDEFHIVQSRPITTLFPIPAADDGGNHVYISVGHQQMMTDAMKPLGISVWQLTSPAPMRTAGGRLFVDVTRQLASPTTRAGLLGMVGRSDPLIGDALHSLLERGDLIAAIDDEAPPADAPRPSPAHTPIEADPRIVEELIRESEASLETLKRDIAYRTGSSLFEFILENLQELRRLIISNPRSYQVILAGMEAAWWLNDRLNEWLGEKNAADTLAQSVAGNVTAEMGLALLDVADVIRPFPQAVGLLERAQNEHFLDELPRVAGGREAREAICAWLARYGMRCPGEIDITRPRWSERPDMLLPMLLGNVRNFGHGAGRLRFEDGLREAQQKRAQLLARLEDLPDGEAKAGETHRMIERLRTFSGYREYPKYAMVSRYFVYKQALLRETDGLVREGVLRSREDSYWLTFHELHDAVRTRHVATELIREREAAFRSYAALTPPRVLTSEGEAVEGAHRREDLPPGMLVGLPVSAGIAEGRARVILDATQGELETGDILVTKWTDPSWTPVFVSITGLVTEVGGLMTHGAVIAREYGLPAVVGVERATQRIVDGQRIRVHGTDGYVEILE